MHCPVFVFVLCCRGQPDSLKFPLPQLQARTGETEKELEEEIIHPLQTLLIGSSV